MQYSLWNPKTQKFYHARNVSAIYLSQYANEDATTIYVNDASVFSVNTIIVIDTIIYSEVEKFKEIKESLPEKISEKVSDIAGLKGKLTSCNGGLDANWLVRKDIPTITFGGGHYKPHSLDEYVEINEYYDACKYAISLATYNT